jgi:hypothetical protein
MDTDPGADSVPGSKKGKIGYGSGFGEDEMDTDLDSDSGFRLRIRNLNLNLNPFIQGSIKGETDTDPVSGCVPGSRKGEMGSGSGFGFLNRIRKE